MLSHILNPWGRMLSRFIQYNVKCGTSLFTLSWLFTVLVGICMEEVFLMWEGRLMKNIRSGVVGKVINLDFVRAWESIFPVQDMSKGVARLHGGKKGNMGKKKRGKGKYFYFLYGFAKRSSMLGLRVDIPQKGPLLSLSRKAELCTGPCSQYV